MAENDIAQFAYSNFFIAMFVSIILTLATGGAALLQYDNGVIVKENILSSISTQSTAATPTDINTDYNSGDFFRSAEDPLFFDIVLGIINVGKFIGKLIGFVLTVFANYFLLSFWLLSSNAPSFIVGLVVMSWQFWQMYYILKFVFKDRIRGGFNQ